MALCVKLGIAGAVGVDEIVGALVKNDLVLKAMAVDFHEEERSANWDDPEAAEAMQCIDPGDDYYTAPYAVVVQKERKRPRADAAVTSLWAVFSAYKCRSAHDDAIKLAGLSGVSALDYGSVMEGALGRGVKPAVYRMDETLIAGGDQVCTKLEDAFFVKACAVAGVGDVPSREAWRAMRAAKLAAECARIGKGIADAPLAALPEYGVRPFAVLTPAERKAQAEAAALAREEEAEAEKERKRQRALNLYEGREAQYGPAVAKFKNAAVPEGPLCVMLFEKETDVRDADRKCTYDRVEGSPFCSMCKLMVEKLG